MYALFVCMLYLLYFPSIYIFGFENVLIFCVVINHIKPCIFVLKYCCVFIARNPYYGFSAGRMRRHMCLEF